MKTCTLLTGLLTLAVAGCGGEAETTTKTETETVAEPRDALAAGWSLRPDDPAEQSAAMRFVQHADGVEAGPGPNACLWHPDLRATGDYRLSVDVTHLDSGLHPHGAGLTFGGQDVHGEGQRYTYFLVRGDRNFLIKTRGGDDTEDVVNWTEHAAVAPEDDDGVTRNRLSVEVRGDEVRFLVNGTEVHRGKREELPTDGQIGLRLVHDLHVKFGRPVVESL
ncbi:MAG: hypothetical protein IPM29_03860 [Planctomycetes bacterium]|nr:hypothetical protein [Planctomycetota bacterium]